VVVTVVTPKIIKVIDDEDDVHRAVVVKQKPLARTGSNLMPMVALGMVAVVLGAIAYRSSGPSPATPSPSPTPADSSGPAQFRPLSVRPGQMKRRAKGDPLDPAVTDALAAFEAPAPPDDPEPPAP
jgi:hypothetical protein